MSDVSGYKQALVDSGIFRFVGNSRYTSRCPFCDDNKGHMYTLINLGDNSPVVYYCFKCNTKGWMNNKFLEYFGIDNIKIPNTKKFTKGQNNQQDYNTTIPDVDILDVNDTEAISGISDYIQSRVGHRPLITDLQYFQFISNPRYYINEYLGKRSNRELDMLTNNRYWFKITSGVIGRYHDDNTDRRWQKCYPRNSNMSNKGLYKLKIPFDVISPINVYVAEGVMDVIGLYYNYIRDNNIYIATLGRDYSSALKYLVSTGIFGKSVNIKIFKDADVPINSIHFDKNLPKMFNQISIYQNLSGKDYGLLPDKLDIHKCVR